MKIKATIDGGNIDVDLIVIDEWAKNQRDGEYTVEIKRYFKNRSLAENRYYHGVVLKILGDELGYEKDEMHYALKEKFIENWEDDNGLKQLKSTSRMDTTTFEEYLSKVRMWASKELHVYIPLPNE